jgi:BlaI family transcriptional regulator, penicillinase repressor
MAALPSLHELEAEVMAEIWRLEEATVRAVADAVNGRSERARSYTTYLTVLVRLDRKGFVARRRVGKHDVYRPAVSREEYRRTRSDADVSALIDEYGDLALAHFARRYSALSPAEKRALRRLAGDD